MTSDLAMVVTPVYCTEENHRLPLLFQTIYSVMQQTYRNLVHVIVDDGSTDETPEVLDELANHHPPILVYHKENVGSSSAVNFGVSEALKEVNPGFITVIHSDDLLTPDSLADRVELIKETGAGMIYTDSVHFFENGKSSCLLSAPDYTDAKLLYDSLLKGKTIPYSTMLWGRDFFLDKLNGYDPEINAAEDWDIALRSAQELSKNGMRNASMHKVTAAHRYHDHNIGYKYLKDGTTWRCYKRIIAKNLQGRKYLFRITRDGLMFFRIGLPESVKKPIRFVRDMILSPPVPPVFLPYRNEFIEEMRKMDCKELLSK